MCSISMASQEDVMRVIEGAEFWLNSWSMRVIRSLDIQAVCRRSTTTLRGRLAPCDRC